MNRKTIFSVLSLLCSLGLFVFSFLFAMKIETLKIEINKDASQMLSWMLVFIVAASLVSIAKILFKGMSIKK